MLFLNSVLSHWCPCLFGCQCHSLFYGNVLPLESFVNHGMVLPLEFFIAVPLWPLLFHETRSDGNLIYQFALFNFPLTPRIQLGHQCPPADGFWCGFIECTTRASCQCPGAETQQHSASCLGGSSPGSHTA